ncbi:MAG: hypothetical protein ACRDZQ_12010 [Acidimicrobiales bacterium]
MLAAINASDAICFVRLGYRSASPSHLDALNVLRGVQPEGETAASELLLLLREKPQVHYRASAVERSHAEEQVSRARHMVKEAGRLVEAEMAIEAKPDTEEVEGRDLSQ